MTTGPIGYVDGYKVGHIHQYPNETALVNSNWTPRKSRIEGISKVVNFGLQYFIKRFLLGEFQQSFFNKSKDEVCTQYVRRINHYLGPDNKVGIDHIIALHDLGYLPILIKALPEGSRSPIGVPQLVIRNTHKDFFWLVNYLETLLSCEIWGPSTSATIAHQYRLLFEYWAEETGGDKEFVLFQGHDFSMRGMRGINDAQASGAAHLLSFRGTDTIPAIDWLEEYYGANCEKELIGASAPATEHAVMCVGTGFHLATELKGDWAKYPEAELAVFKRLITEVYPSGIVSIVSDTWDLWKVLTDYMPKMKDLIMGRKGRLICRPDSGDPVYILTGYFNKELLCDSAGTPILKQSNDIEYYTVKETGKLIREAERRGVIQLLWDTFKGKTNDKGFKILDEHVGAIYGDAITLERANTICERLAARRFVSTNWVAGLGSFSFVYNTRDTLGYALKATYAEALVDKIVEGVQEKVVIPIEIFKDPVTDDGTKKSARGLVRVVKDTEGNFALEDRVTWEEEADNFLEPVFENGKLLKEVTLTEIRERLWATK